MYYISYAADYRLVIMQKTLICEFNYLVNLTCTRIFNNDIVKSAKVVSRPSRVVFKNINDIKKRSVKDYDLCVITPCYQGYIL